MDGGYVEPYYGFNEVNFPLCSKIELLYSKNDLRLLYADNSSGTIPSTSSFFRNISSQTRGLYTPSKNIFSHCFEDEPMSTIMSGSHIDTLNDYKLFTTLINNPEVRSNVYDLHIFTISYFELEFKDGYLIKKI